MAARFSFSKRYNTERLFDIDTDNFDYKSLEDIYVDDEYEYPVRGIYINTKSKFDDAPVIATDDCYVNLPSHLADTCREMLKDKEAIKAINEGYVGFTIYSYVQKRYNKTCYSIHWTDRVPEVE